MRKNLTEIVSVIDESGSMMSIKKDAEGGYKAFIDTQKNVPGEAVVTLYTFNDSVSKLFEEKPIPGVGELTLYPKGTTALLDAIGNAINGVGTRLANKKEEDRPEKVIVCILTDGEENCSREFTNIKIKEMIEHQRSKYGWEFVFLGANQDAFATAGAFGISSGFTSSFAATAAGTRSAYVNMGAMVTNYRTQI